MDINMAILLGSILTFQLFLAIQQFINDREINKLKRKYNDAN